MRSRCRWIATALNPEQKPRPPFETGWVTTNTVKLALLLGQYKDVLLGRATAVLLELSSAACLCLADLTAVLGAGVQCFPGLLTGFT